MCAVPAFVLDSTVVRREFRKLSRTNLHALRSAEILMGV